MLFQVEIANKQAVTSAVFDRFYVKADWIQEVFTKVDNELNNRRFDPQDFRVILIKELTDDLIE